MNRGWEQTGEKYFASVFQLSTAKVPFSAGRWERPGPETLRTLRGKPFEGKPPLLGDPRKGIPVQNRDGGHA